MNVMIKRASLLLSTAIGLASFAGMSAWAAGASGEGSEEITVTAQKRSESSLKVPMGLTALSGKQLEDKQAYRLEDFVGKVPGLNLSTTIGAQLVVRGVASSASSINAPVATYIDETPLVGVGAFSGGSLNTPNIDTFDLARVEVLKGPQGTLYGANALGGLLKYVTNPPDPTRTSSKFQGGASTVSGGGTGYNAHAMVNVPLGENAAFRVVGYDNQYGGYIDDPTRGNDVNDMRVYGARGSVLWNPTADLSIRLSVLDHERRWGGIGYVDVAVNTLKPLYCDTCQKRDVDQPGSSYLRYFNGTVTWNLGSIEVTSSTTYDRWQFRQFQNLVALNSTADALKGVPGTGRWGFQVDFDYYGHEIVHETRLQSKNDGMWNWQVGLYYTDKDTVQNQTYLPVNRLTHLIETAEFGGSKQPASYREFAVFANLDVQITPTFDVSLGGRYSDESQTFEQIGRLVAPSLSFRTMDDDVFTYSATARWQVTPDSMLYARIASGFVPGGPNVAAFNAPVPATYGSSTTTNYEIGYKTAMLDHRLTAELSLFQINWDDIQLTRTIGIYNVIANGGKAESRGAEFALNYTPLDGLSLGFNAAYTDAHLTQDLPPGTGGFDGNRLPVTPRWQLAASADYRFAVADGFEGFVGGEWRYISQRFAEFTPATRQQMPGFSTVDLRAGVETEAWTVSLYAKNVGDTRGINYIGAETGSATQVREYLITPRTFGVEFTANF